MNLKNLILNLLVCSFIVSCNTPTSDILTLEKISKANTLLIKAIDLSKEKKYDEAIKELNEALKLNKFNTIIYYELGYNYYYLKNYNEAEKYLNKAIELDKEHSFSYNTLGSIYFLKKDYQKALKNYLKVLELEKEKIQTEDFYTNLGVVYESLGNKSDAEKYYNKALEITKDKRNIYNKISLFLYDNKMENSIIYINKALELSKTNKEKAECYHFLGNIYSDLNKDDLAIINYNKSIDLDDSIVGNYLDLGLISIKQNKYEEAEKYYFKALEKNNKHYAITLALGNLYSLKKQYDKAEEYYKKTIDLAPKNNVPYNQLGLLYFNIEKYDKAEQLLLKSIEINDKYEASYINLANVFHKLKKPKEKAFYDNKVIELNPKNKDSWNSLGVYYYSQKDYKKSEDAFKKAISIDSNFEVANENLLDLNKRNETFGSYSNLGLIVTEEPTEVISKTDIDSRKIVSFSAPIFKEQKEVSTKDYNYGALTCSNSNFDYLNSFILPSHPQAKKNYEPFISTSTNLQNYEYTYNSTKKTTGDSIIKFNLYEKPNFINNQTILEILRKIKIEMGYKSIDCSILVIKCPDKNECSNL